MQNPEIETTLNDGDGVLWRVMAYRKLSEQEMLQTIRTYLQGIDRRKWPAPGSGVTLTTVIGMLPGM
jgi:hypothetical protein